MLVETSNVHKSFRTSDGNIAVLRGIDFGLSAREMVALTGESGSGKSTLLHLIAGLDDFDDGEITVGGLSLRGLSDTKRAELRRETVGIVFQQFNLIPSLTARENLCFYARLAGKEDRDWTRFLEEELGLQDHLDHYPEQLSGGQQQRVAIGRTLAARPKLVMADEPTGNLDEETSDKVIDLMISLVEETGAGLLMVTHSTRLAGRMSRRVHLRAGKIE